jgi:hypothetical protein
MYSRKRSPSEMAKSDTNQSKLDVRCRVAGLSCFQRLGTIDLGGKTLTPSGSDLLLYC